MDQQRKGCLLGSGPVKHCLPLFAGESKTLTVVTATAKCSRQKAGRVVLDLGTMFSPPVLDFAQMFPASS